MNSNCLLAFTEVMTHDRMRQLCSVTFCTAMMIHCWSHYYWDRYHWQWHCRKQILWAWVLYRILSLSSMDLAINNVTNLCNFMGKMFVCVCVWVSVYLELLSHFLPFKIHLTNILPILIKMVDFKNLAWATSLATGASRKFIYLLYRASGKKSYCHTLCTDTHMHTHTNTDLSVSPSATAMWYGSNKVCTPSNMLCASWWYLAKSWNKTVHMKGSAHFHLKTCFVSPQNSTKYFMQIFKTQHQASIKYKSLWHRVALNLHWSHQNWIESVKLKGVITM